MKMKSGRELLAELKKQLRHGLDVILLDPYAPLAGGCAVEYDPDKDPFIDCMADAGRDDTYPRLIGHADVNPTFNCISCNTPVANHDYGPFATPDDEHVAKVLGMTVQELRADREEEARLAAAYAAPVGSDMV